MASRRQEKVASVIKSAVSEIILTELHDPRIDGFVSITNVNVSPDLRNAEVFLSIMADTETKKLRTFEAIEHANRHIQKELSQRMTMRYCPHLHFTLDEKWKSTMETLRLIEQTRAEHEGQQEQDEQTESENEE